MLLLLRLQDFDREAGRYVYWYILRAVLYVEPPTIARGGPSISAFLA